MSVSRRLFHIVRSQVRGAAASLPPSLGRLGDRVADTLRATRRAYREGRAAGDPSWSAGAGAAAGGGAGGGAGDAADASRWSGHARGRRDPQMVGWYANLEVPYGSDLDTVTRAWKRLARLYHPDRHDADPQRRAHATELIKGINQAYEQLRRRLEPS